jgi:hypothetical protein
LVHTSALDAKNKDVKKRDEGYAKPVNLFNLCIMSLSSRAAQGG